MEKTKVTAEALRRMAIGETKTFELANAAAIQSGKAMAYTAQHTLGCRFRAESDFANNRLTLTKLEKI